MRKRARIHLVNAEVAVPLNEQEGRMAERPFIELATMDRGVHLEVCALDIADERYVDLELIDVSTDAFSLHARLTRCQVDALIAELRAACDDAWPTRQP